MEEVVLRAVSITLPPPPGRAGGWCLLPRVRFLSDVQPPQLPSRSLNSPTRDPGQQVSAAHSSLALLQGAPLSGVSPLPLPGCPTAGTSPTFPLIPLACRLGAWLALPSPSCWLIRTVQLGYAIQFARRPPKFRGIHFTSVQSDTDASVLHCDPPAEMKTRFYSPYFIVPKKSGGLRPILDLQALNRSLHRLPFKMLTPKRILSCVATQPNPEMGMAPRYLPGRRYPGMPPSLQPVVRPCIPTGRSLRRALFKPLGSVELKFLSLKTVLLTALTSVKRVGDLQAFSVNEACPEFVPADSHVILRPSPGYVPKVPITPFRDQVVNLQALPSEEADPALALLCPIRALRIYVDRTRGYRSSEQLFVCFGGQQKGNAVSKQRLAH
ncbi:Cyclic di-GMP phosphodiesterase CdpA [Labeo rohita]|uniref:Cyclic di-GMP phosphodiesterase CdpA n=1 Tax=Labeo rohita TaxID=84645 RepID=A0ABQ8M7A2_LABRO|nr:Cyclic di-GMP phosphodiesterase CdpA [Labeo rohita]